MGVYLTINSSYVINRAEVDFGAFSPSPRGTVFNYPGKGMKKYEK